MPSSPQTGPLEAIDHCSRLCHSLPSLECTRTAPCLRRPHRLRIRPEPPHHPLRRPYRGSWRHPTAAASVLLPQCISTCLSADLSTCPAGLRSRCSQPRRPSSLLIAKLTGATCPQEPPHPSPPQSFTHGLAACDALCSSWGRRRTPQGDRLCRSCRIHQRRSNRSGVSSAGAVDSLVALFSHHVKTWPSQQPHRSRFHRGWRSGRSRSHSQSLQSKATGP